MGNHIKTHNQSGLSIVATVMVMMILALFAAVAVSLVTTGAGTGIQEERGTQAFYIADGGMQYTLKKNTYPYYDGDYDPPLSDYPISDIALGDGSFTVTVPTLSSGIDTTDPIDISLSPSTDGFATAPDGSYWVLICGVTGSPRPTIKMSSDCEKISFTTKGSSSFSTGTRGKDSTDAAAHPSNSVVMMYSWDTAKTAKINTRTFGKGDKCTNASSTICVSDRSPFADSGFIRIHYPLAADENKIEDVFYDGKGTTGSCGTGCSACLGTNGCKRRAFDGNGKGTVNHISGTTIYQSEFSVLTTSTGVVSGAILTGNIKRGVQGNILSLKDP
jgi:type II secretory pathway pseudopilin PulG